MRLPREPSNPERLKGFGYAEFEDLDSLLSALSLNEEVKNVLGGSGGEDSLCPDGQPRGVGWTL